VFLDARAAAGKLFSTGPIDADLAHTGNVALKGHIIINIRTCHQIGIKTINNLKNNSLKLMTEIKKLY
jgi:hypothetical protein